jgi:hypothetical protein
LEFPGKVLILHQYTSIVDIGIAGTFWSNIHFFAFALIDLRKFLFAFSNLPSKELLVSKSKSVELKDKDKFSFQAKKERKMKPYYEATFWYFQLSLYRL